MLLLHFMVSKDVGNGIWVEPYFPVISWDRTLVIGPHRASIGVDKNSIWNFMNVCHIVGVAKDAGSGFVVQEDPLLHRIVLSKA